MAGTQIDVAAVRRAGDGYAKVADDIGTAAARLHAPTASVEDFGRHYGEQGQGYLRALEGLARSVDAWRDGSRAVGAGLTNSAAAHANTDARSAGAVQEAGGGR